MQTLTIAKHKRRDCDHACWGLFIDGELTISYGTFSAAQDAFIAIARYMTD